MGVQNKQSGSVKNCVLRRFGHVERIDDERNAKRVYDSGVQGRRVRGRPTRVWMDGVKETVTNKGLTLEQARVTVHDRAEWRGLVNRDE